MAGAGAGGAGGALLAALPLCAHAEHAQRSSVSNYHPRTSFHAFTDSDHFSSPEKLRLKCVLPRNLRFTGNSRL